MTKNIAENLAGQTECVITPEPIITGWKDVDALEKLTEGAYNFLLLQANAAAMTVGRVAWLVQSRGTEGITLKRLAEDLDLTTGRLSQMGSTYGTLVRLNVPKNGDTWKIAAAFNREVKADARESLIATVQAESGTSATERLAQVAELTRNTRNAKKSAATDRANVNVPVVGPESVDNGDVKVPDMSTVAEDTTPEPDATAPGQADKSETREAQPDVRDVKTDGVSTWSKAEFLAALTRMAEYVESDARQWALKTDGEHIRATDALARIEAAVIGASVEAV